MTDSADHHGNIAGETEEGCGIPRLVPGFSIERRGRTIAGYAGSRVSATASMTGCAPAPRGLIAELEPQGR